jgi:hypothetical protein
LSNTTNYKRSTGSVLTSDKIEIAAGVLLYRTFSQRLAYNLQTLQPIGSKQEPVVGTFEPVVGTFTQLCPPITYKKGNLTCTNH